MPNVIVTCTFNPPLVSIQGAGLRQDTLELLQRALPQCTNTRGPPPNQSTNFLTNATHNRHQAPKFHLSGGTVDGVIPTGTTYHSTSGGIRLLEDKERDGVETVTATASTSTGVYRLTATTTGGGSISDRALAEYQALLSSSRGAGGVKNPYVRSVVDRGSPANSTIHQGVPQIEDGHPINSRDASLRRADPAGEEALVAVQPESSSSSIDVRDYHSLQLLLPSHYCDQQKRSQIFLAIMGALEEEGYSMRSTSSVTDMETGKDTTRLFFSK